jgi:chromosome segregation ATPase
MLARLRSTIAGWKAEVTAAHAGLTQQIESTCAQLAGLVEGLDQREDQALQLGIAHDEIQQLRRALDAAALQPGALTQYTVDRGGVLDTIRQEWRASHQRLQSTIATWTQEVAAAQKGLTSQIAQAAVQFDALITLLEREVHAPRAQAAHGAPSELVESLRRENTTLSDHISALARELTELRQQQGNAPESPGDDTVRLLQNEAAMFRDVLADRDETLEAARAALQQLQAERDTLVAQLRDSGGAVAPLPDAQAGVLAQQRDVLQATLQHLESQLGVLQEREAQGLARVQGLLQEIEAQRDGMRPDTGVVAPGTSADTVEAAQSEIAALREQLAAREAQLETQKTRFAEIERHGAALRHQLENIFSDSENAADQARALAGALEDRDRRIVLLQEGLQVAQRALEAAEKREQTWAEQRAQWETAIGDAEEARRAGIALVQADLDAAQARIQYMESSLSETQQRVAGQHLELEAAQAALAAAAAHAEGQVQALERAAAETLEAANQTAHWQALQAETEAARAALEEACTKQEADVAASRAAAESATAEAIRMAAVHQELSDTLQTAMGWLKAGGARSESLEADLAASQAHEASSLEKLRQLSLELDDLRSAEFARAEVLARERAEAAALRITLSEREDDIRALREQTATLETDLTVARADASEASTRHADLATQLEALKAERTEQAAWAEEAQARLTNLESALEHLLMEKTGLSSSLAETELRAIAAEEEKTRLAAALEALQATSALQQASLEDASGRLLAHETELLRLNEETARLTEALGSAQAEEGKAQADLATLQGQLDSMRHEREAQETRIREAQALLRANEAALIQTSAENEGLAARLAEILPRHEAAEEERARLAAHLETLRAETDAQATEVQRAQDRLRMHERALEQLTAERETLERSLDEVRAREAQDREEQARVVAQLEALRTAHADLEAWVGAAEARLGEQELALTTLTSEKTWLNNALEETQSREQSALQEKRALAEELAALRMAHAELEPQFDAARRRLQEQEGALGRIMTEMDEITRTLAVAQRRESDALRERDEVAGQMQALKRDRDAEAAALFEAHRRLETQEADIERLDRERAAMAGESEAALAREQAARAERDRLVDELASLQQRQGSDAASIAEVQQQLTHQESALQATVEENARLAQEVAEAVSREEAIRADHERLQAALDALESEKSGALTRLEALEAALAHGESMLAQRESDIEALQINLDVRTSELQSLHEQEAAAREAADTLRDRLTYLETEALPAVEALAETQETVEQLRQALAAQEAEAAAFAASAQTLEADLQRLQEEQAERLEQAERASTAQLEELQVMLQAQQNDLQQRDDLVSELRDALGKLEGELAEQRGVQQADNGQLREVMSRLNEAVQERDQAMAAVQELKDTRRRLLLGATGGRGHAAQRGVEAQRRDILLAQAVSQDERSALGEMLVQAGLITPQQLKDALKKQRKSPGQLLGTILLQEEWTTEDAIAQAVACQLDIPLVEVTPNACEPDAVRLLDRDICTWHVCVPLRVSAKRLVVAMANPLDEAALQKMQEKSRREIRPVVATGSAILGAIEAVYGGF